METVGFFNSERTATFYAQDFATYHRKIVYVRPTRYINGARFVVTFSPAKDRDYSTPVKISPK